MTADLENFTFQDEKIRQQPHPFYSIMRSEIPVFPTEIAGQPVWLVTTDALCREVLTDPATYSSRFSLNMKPSREILDRIAELRQELDAYPRVNTLVTADPPAHDRYRKLVSAAFTPKFVDRFKTDFAAIASDLIGSWQNPDDVEIRTAFAEPMALRSIVKALGFDDARIDDLQRWSHATLVSLGTTVTEEEYLDGERGIIEFHHYLVEQIKLRQGSPRDDMITRLLKARLPAEEAAGGDAALSFPEIIDLMQSFLVAGNHTTGRALTELVRLLVENPDVFESCRRNPNERDAVIDECLRLATPAQGLWRRATRDSVLGGVEIPARAKLFVLFASANRDGTLYAEPDEFRPGRPNGAGHLSFGRGIHYCLGQNMARVEIRAAMNAICDGLESVELVEGQELEYEANFVARGLLELHVAVTRRAHG